MKNIKIGKISAAIHEPDVSSDKLAILLPGYLDSKDYPHLVALAEDLKNDGYTAVRFDPAGTWESEGDISEYTISGQLEGVRNVLEYMLKQYQYKNILLGGHSRGGFVSILYAAQDPRISKVLGIMPPYALIKTVDDDKIENWRKTGFRISKRDIPNSKEEKEFRVPYSNIEDTKQYNVLETVSKLHIPVLLVTGEFDDVISPEDVKKIYDKANEPKKFIELKNIDHDYRLNPGDIKKVNSEITKWLK